MAAGSGTAPEAGARAARAARRKYGLVTESCEWYDLVHPANGYRYQVKACRTETDRGQPGRWRLWKADHQRMIDHRGCYIFAVYAPESGRIWKIEKVSTTDVDDLVRGKWYPSGHHSKGQQYKLSWRDVFR